MSSVLKWVVRVTLAEICRQNCPCPFFATWYNITKQVYYFYTECQGGAEASIQLTSATHIPLNLEWFFTFTSSKSLGQISALNRRTVVFPLWSRGKYRLGSVTIQTSCGCWTAPFFSGIKPNVISHKKGLFRRKERWLWQLICAILYQFLFCILHHSSIIFNFRKWRVAIRTGFLEISRSLARV